MVIIPFTRKREIKGLKEPSLFSKRIQLSSEVKYLGIKLDKELIWRKQLYKAINKAYKRPSGHAEAHLVKLGD
jgi:hypothetical protein